MLNRVDETAVVHEDEINQGKGLAISKRGLLLNVLGRVVLLFVRMGNLASDPVLLIRSPFQLR